MRDTSTKPAVLKVIAVVILVVAVQVGAALAIYQAIPGWEERGQFGDMFGAVNTLFSGLALAAVAYALVLQSKELALQREELKATREEVRKSVAAQEALAAVTASQYELERRARDESERIARERLVPRFRKRNLGAPKATGPWHLALSMLGERIRDVTAVSEAPGFDLSFSPRDTMDQRNMISLRIDGDKSEVVPFVLHYVDSDGRKRHTRYTVEPGKGIVTYIEEVPEPAS